MKIGSYYDSIVTKYEAVLFVIKNKEKVDYSLLRAKDRLIKAKEVQKEKRLKNPKYKKPDIPDSNSEIENLEKKLEYYSYIIPVLLEDLSISIRLAYGRSNISKKEYELLIDTYNKLKERYENKIERK